MNISGATCCVAVLLLLALGCQSPGTAATVPGATIPPTTQIRTELERASSGLQACNWVETNEALSRGASIARHHALWLDPAFRELLRVATRAAIRQGQLEKVEPFYREAYRAVGHIPQPETVALAAEYGAVMVRLGQRWDWHAQPLLRHALVRAQQIPGVPSSVVAHADQQLGELALRDCRLAEAKYWLEQARTLQEQQLPASVDPLVRTELTLARLHADSGEHANAEQPLKRALGLVRYLQPSRCDRMAAIHQKLAGLYRALDKDDLEVLSRSQSVAAASSCPAGRRLLPAVTLELWQLHSARNDAAAAERFRQQHGIVVHAAGEVPAGKPTENPSSHDASRGRCKQPAKAPSHSVSNAASVVASLRGDFRECYQKALRVNPQVEGMALLTAHVGAHGEVRGVYASASGLGPQLLACLVSRVTTARFVPPEGGGAIITIPISFVIRKTEQQCPSPSDPFE